MSTVGRSPKDHDPGPLTDLRTVVIALIALVVAAGTALGTGAVTAATGVDVLTVLAAALGAGGTTMAVMAVALHSLISKE